MRSTRALEALDELSVLQSKWCKTWPWILHDLSIVRHKFIVWWFNTSQSQWLAGAYSDHIYCYYKRQRPKVCIQLRNFKRYEPAGRVCTCFRHKLHVCFRCPNSASPDTLKTYTLLHRSEEDTLQHMLQTITTETYKFSCWKGLTGQICAYVKNPESMCWLYFCLNLNNSCEIVFTLGLSTHAHLQSYSSVTSNEGNPMWLILYM